MNKKSKTDSIVNKEEAMKIARDNAANYYRDLSIYDIEVKYEDGNWHVDYLLNNPGMVGGGPHYVISAITGQIVSCRFDQ